MGLQIKKMSDRTSRNSFAKYFTHGSAQDAKSEMTEQSIMKSS